MTNLRPERTEADRWNVLLDFLSIGTPQQHVDRVGGCQSWLGRQTHALTGSLFPFAWIGSASSYSITRFVAR